MRNKAQVTIFIIIAIIIVVVIILLFLFKVKIEIPGTNTRMPPIQQDIEKCVKDSVEQATSIMLPQGGYLEPKNYKLYKDNKVEYLCYQTLYYKPCINQQPAYLEHLKSEIKTYIAPKIEDCFYNLEQEYNSKQYAIEMSPTSLDINLNPKQIEVSINKKIEISKNEENKRYDSFIVKINSPVYDLGVIANEIANQEAKFCYFEYLGYMMLYPEFEISKIDINGETKIYEIKDRYSNEVLNIAVRSCAMPAGF